MTASEEQQFVQLLDNMMALDNNVRTEAEVILIILVKKEQYFKNYSHSL